MSETTFLNLLIQMIRFTLISCLKTYPFFNAIFFLSAKFCKLMSSLMSCSCSINKHILKVLLNYIMEKKYVKYK